MYTIYAAGYATGQPSPGGASCIITFGKRVVQLYTRELSKTSPTHASLIAVRDGLRLIEENSSAHIVVTDELTNLFISGSVTPQQETLQKLSSEIESIVRQKHLNISSISSSPGTIKLLDEALEHARESASASWLTGNSPRCPKCSGKMVVKHRPWGDYWECERAPECRGRINIYEEGDG